MREQVKPKRKGGEKNMANLSKQDLALLEQAEANRIAANQAALQKAAEASKQAVAERAAESAAASLKLASAEYQKEVAQEVAKASGAVKRQKARESKRGQFSLLGHRAGSQGFQFDEAAIGYINAYGKFPEAEELVKFAPELVEYPLSRVKGHLAHVRAKHADDIRKNFPGI